MKIRKGYVSNSSSSSFVVAFGQIDDREKFDKWITENSIDKYNYEIYSYDNINDAIYYTEIDWAQSGGSVYLSKSDIEKLDKNKEFFAYFECDDYYNYYEDDGWDNEIDYDAVEPSDVSTKAEIVYDSANSSKSGLTHVQIGYGAGRNG